MSAPMLRYFSGTSQVSPLNSNVFVNRDSWSVDHVVYQRSPIDDYNTPLDPLQRELEELSLYNGPSIGSFTDSIWRRTFSLLASSLSSKTLSTISRTLPQILPINDQIM